MKNQLFRISPDIPITESILQLFGIKDINDNHSFTRENLIDLKTVEKMNELSKELFKYYIPCKSKIYLVELNEKKCITILRQFLKVNNYTLISKEKYIKGNKQLFYQVIPQQIDILTKNRESEKVVLSFD
tara:strand:- start:1168 stop:1557 length:390 start_codon:yes stop_codon:yes gene_type:complete